MKLRTIPVFALLTLSLWLASCSTGTSIEVSCDDFMQQKHISKEVSAAVGDSFTVTLCSNATTGFKWSESAQISDQTVLQQTGHEFVSPEAEGIVGAPGKEVWTFKALKKGTSTLSVEYGRPWEGGEKGEWTFNLTMVVK
ncbi:MAG: protease inhibitor I42 family protein [Chloroflexi bacterium]|nr:protease inhibitor I42 family protein [Chloroflexota bacterium]